MPDQQAIIVKPMGRMANQMIQLMLAVELRQRAGTQIPILGYDIPEWGLKAPAHSLPKDARGFNVAGHKFNLDEAATALRLGLADIVRVQAYAQRLEYFREPSAYAPLFQAPEIEFYRANPDEIVLNVRGGDILSGQHPLYFPMPAAYYEKIVSLSGLKPVFVGEVHDSVYGDLLRRTFPDAKFLQSTPVSDFQTLRHARHVALSLSSFSWLATWLSATAETIHMPVCGIFEPSVDGPMLVPLNDPRYRFYKVPFPHDEARQQIDLGQWLTASHSIEPLAQKELIVPVARSIVGAQHPPSVVRKIPGVKKGIGTAPNAGSPIRGDIRVKPVR